MIVSRYQETSVVYRSSVLWLFSGISLVLVISAQNRRSETAVTALLLTGEWYYVRRITSLLRVEIYFHGNQSFNLTIHQHGVIFSIDE